MTVIVDYGMGNIASIKNMLKKIGVVDVVVSSKPEDIEKATKLILPGVGAFDNAVVNLNQSELIPALNQKVIAQKTPILGICLGMQLLTNSSEEGKLPGLSWIDAEVKLFHFKGNNSNLKIPHMGWNYAFANKNNALINKDEKNRYYFVHSYHVECKNEEDILTQTNYGIKFTSGIQKDNIYGVQFHPEKSHKFGMNLLNKFAQL